MRRSCFRINTLTEKPCSRTQLLLTSVQQGEQILQSRSRAELAGFPAEGFFKNGKIVFVPEQIGKPFQFFSANPHHRRPDIL